ncbi:MAG TPA: hypothetical protein VHM19_16065 [Polyangiales bacterium]|nr:hypothetical protein [Polyangiales bacterium]
MALAVAGCGTKSDSGPGGGSTPDAGMGLFHNAPGEMDGAMSTHGGGDFDASALLDANAPNCKPTHLKKADLLFVVDDSNSMREEQAALKDQFPKLIQALVSGKRSANDPHPFPPLEDLHLAVVSVNMGLIGVNGIPGCSGYGDDGVFQHTATNGDATCKASYPPFLAYQAGGSQTPEQLASDFGCVAELGTDGCGFEQQLESPLKALWPSIDVDPLTGQTISPNRITFLTDGTDAMRKLGHGDRENQGFLRRDPNDPSLLGIVMVTDEEDCSSSVTKHFTPANFLDPSDPLYAQDLNLRCFYNPQNLYPVERYVKGFQALHEGNKQLVVYAAIVGVPPDLVDAQARKMVDFKDAASRDAYYTKLLGDPRMQEVPDPARPMGQGRLMPSCDTPTGVAFPPRRLVKVAQAMGENGIVQSICQSDFSPALDAIIDKLGERLTETCVVQ